jgi:hypothetical protein
MNISNFNQFFESKNLHNKNIPESVFQYLFKERLFKNNDLNLIEISTKKELRKKLKNNSLIQIFAFKDEDNFLFMYKPWSYYDLNGKKNSVVFHKYRLSLTTALSNITKDYKLYSVENNSIKYNKYKRYQESSNLDFNDKIFNFVIVHLKKLRKKADAELIESLNDFQKSNVHDKYNPKQPVHTTDTIAAIYNINTMIYDFEQSDQNAATKLLKNFNESEFKEDEKYRLNNKKTTINHIMFEKITRIVNNWLVEDFYNFHSSRILFTKKEKQQEKSKKFNL